MARWEVLEIRAMLWVRAAQTPGGGNAIWRARKLAEIQYVSLHRVDGEEIRVQCHLLGTVGNGVRWVLP
eukprot:3610054-Lingulodinium_polyedra.AAC.1